VLLHSQTLSFNVELVGHGTQILLMFIILFEGQDTHDPVEDLTPTAH